MHCFSCQKGLLIFGDFFHSMCENCFWYLNMVQLSPQNSSFSSFVARAEPYSNTRNSSHTSNEKNLQKSAILFGTKSNAYLQINCPIFAYSWLFLPIFAYLRICSKSPRIYFAFHAKYPCLFLLIFRHLTCV